MITVQDKKAFTDLSIIIKMMPKYMQNQINHKFINLIEQNKDINYISNIKPNVPIKYQKLSETTQALMALIYRDYLCNEEERNELLTAENEAIKKIEDENRKKYEINFKKTNKNLYSESVSNTLIEYKKETFITKIINKIRNFFNFS